MVSFDTVRNWQLFSGREAWKPSDLLSSIESEILVALGWHQDGSATRARPLRDDGEHCSAHRADGVDLVLYANEAYSEMIELFQCRKQMACAALERVEFPD